MRLLGNKISVSEVNALRNSVSRKSDQLVMITSQRVCPDGWNSGGTMCGPLVTTTTNSPNPVSHACDGQIGREPRLANVWRGAVFQNHQFASCVSKVVPSPILGRDYASQHRFRSSVCLHLAHGEVVTRHRSRTRRRATSLPTLMHWPRWPHAHAGQRLAQQSCCP